MYLYYKYKLKYILTQTLTRYYRLICYLPGILRYGLCRNSEQDFKNKQ
jgi:hypothetical protein